MQDIYEISLEFSGFSSLRQVRTMSFPSIIFFKTMLKIMKILWSLDEVFFQLRRKMLICRNAFVFTAHLISAVAI